MKPRKPLSTILSLLFLVGSVVVVGLMLGGVLEIDSEPGDEPPLGLESEVEDTPPAAEVQGEPLESPGGEETAREAITPVEEPPGLLVYALQDPDDHVLVAARFALFMSPRQA